MPRVDQINYRRATGADIPALVQIRAVFLAEVSEADPNDPALRDAIARYFSATIASEDFVTLLAVADDRVIATGGLVYHRHPPSQKNLSGREPYVLNMYTLPEFRGRGIATKILRELAKIVRAGGGRRIRLHTYPKAAAVYARLGFVPTGDEMKWDLV
jgi:GNAT superfamily N-acetyltransferase